MRYGSGRPPDCCCLTAETGMKPRLCSSRHFRRIWWSISIGYVNIRSSNNIARRILTEVVVQLAAEQPDGLWVKAGASANGALSWRAITWSQLATAVDYVSHWMETRLGPPGKNEIVAYMGINDIRYPIMILAAMKTAYKVLLTSPCNSQDAQASLLKSTECKKFLHTPDFAAQMQDLVVHHPELDPVEIPGLDQVWKHEHASTPYHQCRLPQEDDIALILHSSGSTGSPKPIFIRTGALAVVDTIRAMPAAADRRDMHDELFAPTLMLSMTLCKEFWS